MRVGPFKLFPLQERAYNQSREAMLQCFREKATPNVIVQAPCGFGKTILSSYVMQEAIEKSRKPAFIVHGRQLVFQKSEKLSFSNIAHEVVMAKCKGELHIQASQYRDGSPTCSVISKDTYEAILDRGVENPFDIDLWIIDECHSARSEGWWKLIGRSKPAPVYGLTATPCWSDGSGMGDRYSKIVVAATHDELFEAEMIVPCRYIDPWGIDTRGVKINKESGEFDQSQVECCSMPLVGDFLEEWFKKGEMRPTAFFASSVAHSIAQTEAFREGDGTLFHPPQIWEHVDADTKQSERKRIYKGLAKGDIQGVSNYGVLRVGFDCPAISCIQLGVAMYSLVAFLQTCGRGARTCKGKKDFIIIDHGSHLERHGWPQDDRDWSLERRILNANDPKSQTKKAPDKICAKCGRGYRGNASVCPDCGVSDVRSGRMVKTIAGELVEVERQDVKPRKKSKVSEMQRALDKIYYSSKNGRGNPTFNVIRARLLNENKHLTIQNVNGETHIKNKRTGKSHRLGLVPEPHSSLWDVHVKTTNRERLQLPVFEEGGT